MPSEQEHLTQAHHNEVFVRSLNIQTTAYPDWAVTGIFYAALHYIEAFLATQGIHPKLHRSRDTMFGRFPQLQPVYVQYRALKDDSVGARYDLQVFTTNDVQGLWNNELATIKRQLSYS